MPAQHRWVADWLFVDADDAFHHNVPVPPESFDNTLAVQINHTFTEIEIPAKCPHPMKQTYAQRSACASKCPITGKTMAEKSKRPSSKITTADLLLLPVANLDVITVGYAFGGGSYISDTGATKAGPPFCGRFAFNIVEDDLLIVINGKPPGSPSHFSPVTVIMTVALVPGTGTREHTFFTCPKQEYGFEHLPSQILNVVTAEGTTHEQLPEPLIVDTLEDLLAGRELDSIASSELLGASVATAPWKENLLDILPEEDSSSFLLTESSNGDSPLESENTMVSTGGMDFIQSLLDDIHTTVASPASRATTRATPWEMDAFRGTRDGVGISRVPGGNSTSSGAFDLRALSGALSAMSASLRGSYKATKRKCGTDPLTGCTVGETLMSVVATLERADESVTAKLQRQAAALYFAATMTVRSDEGRLNAMMAVQVLPVQYTVHGHGSAGMLVECDNSEEMRMREERREAKKRRNRMSAARSNQRRKEANEVRKRSLAELKMRAEELEERKRSLAAENHALKERIFLGDVLGAGSGVSCGPW